MKKNIRTVLAFMLAAVMLLGAGASAAVAPAYGAAIEIPAPESSLNRFGRDNNTVTFTDVPDWCAAAARWAANKGIANGVGNNKFAPNDPCPNSQIITMLWRAAGEPAASSASPFTVVSYSQVAVNWAYGKGIIDPTFRPDDTCTRSGAMLFVWRAFDSPSASTNTGFSDVSSSANYAKAVSWAVTNGIVAGTGNNQFSPNQPCTRGTIVTLLHRAYVPEVRLDTGNGGGSGNGSAQPAAPTARFVPENTLKSYGDIHTVVKSVSNPSAPVAGNKNTTSYGTVDYSTASNGYITFTASGAERVFKLQSPDGTLALFTVAKGSTITVALVDGAGKYQYAIGHNLGDGTWATDYKNSFTVSKIDDQLSMYLLSTPYGDYANAPVASAKAAELWDSTKTQLDNVRAIAKYVRSLKYDKSLKAGGLSQYVSPDDVIANGGGVCNEMTKLLVAMLRSQGIPAYYQCGANANGQCHAWAMAWLETASETKDGTVYSTGTWVLIEATDGYVNTTNNAVRYTTDTWDYAN